MPNGMTRRERQVTDEEHIRHILQSAKILHLGMVDGEKPYVVPMNYGYILENGKLTLYLHGARRGRKLDVLRLNPKVFFEMECDVQPFTDAVACKYGMAYSSLMGEGKAVIVEDVSEKQRSLTTLMQTQAEKEFTFTEKLADVVGVIRIDVEWFTAKHRPVPQNG